MAWIRLVAIVVVALISSPARACYCTSSPTVAEEFAASRDVFIGRVEETWRADAGEEEEFGGVYIWARVAASTRWKGAAGGEVLVRTTQTSCGHYFNRGEVWMLFAGPDGTVQGCGRSTKELKGWRARLGPPLAHRILPPPVPTALDAALAVMDAGAVKAALAAGAPPNERPIGGHALERAVDACAADVVEVLVAVSGLRRDMYGRALRCPDPTRWWSPSGPGGRSGGR